MTTKNISYTSKVKSAYPPGPTFTNHNETALKIRKGVKDNHNQSALKIHK